MRLSIATIVLFIALAGRAATVGPQIPVTADPPRAAQETPSVSMPRGGALVAWRDSGVQAVRLGTPPVDSTGVVRLDDVFPRDLATAARGDDALVVWVKNDDVLARLLGADGRPISAEVPLAFVDSRLTSRVAVAASQAQFLAVWNERTRLMAKVVDQRGSAAPEAVRIFDGAFGQNIDRIAVASDGEEFLVVWESSPNEPWGTPCQLTCPEGERAIRAVVVRADGTPRPETEIVIADSGEMPDVTWNGHQFLVVWGAGGGGGILARHIGMPGASLDVTRPLITYAASGPRIAWDGAAYVLAFVRLEPHALLVQRMGPDLLASADLGSEPIINGAHPRHFALAASAGRATLAYSDGRLYVRQIDLRAAGRLRAVRR